MRNLKLGLFSMLCAIFIFWITTAFDINVWPENYYWTLTLNRVNIMKSYGITWIVLDGTWYEISIASGATNWYWKISVYRICWQGWWNCKQVSQLSTTTPVMNSINDNWLVEKTNGVANKVWKTNARWEPQWLDDATGSISINAYTPTLSRGSPSTIIKINDSTATVTLPSNPHYVWSIVASTRNWTSNTNTTDPYLNYVENSTVKSRIQIKWSGSIGVSANDWTITITSTWGGWWDSLWTGSSDKTKIRQTDETDAVVIWRHEGNLYESYIEFQGSWSYKTPWMCSTTTNYGGQVILYWTKMLIGRSNIITCSNDKVVEINPNWLWINAEADGTYALNVWWDAYMTSIRANSATIGTHVFSNKVWINTNPDPTWATFQVNGGIKIGSNWHSTCVNWTIDYTGGNFYGCRNGTRKKFLMQGDCNCTSS